jgi:hypothetical protein
VRRNELEAVSVGELGVVARRRGCEDVDVEPSLESVELAVQRGGQG